MNPWIDIAGWMLVHFVWQGALIGAAAAAAFRLLRTASPQARYVVACLALAVMVAAPIATARVISGTRLTSEPISAGSEPSAALALANETEPLAGSRVTGTDSSLGTLRLPRAEAGLPFSIDAALPLVVMFWMAGVACLLARMAGGWLRVRRVYRASLTAMPSRWDRAGSRIAVLLGVPHLVRVVDSPFVDTPTVVGWLRPVILLPVAALSNLTPSQVDAILAHELAHIRRHDYLANLLQTLAETVLFYHPAVWWLSARIRAERELCCDLVAVNVCGDAVGYAEALAELETWRTADAMLAVAATDGSLLERIRRLLGVAPDDAPRPVGAMTIAAVIAFMVVAAGATHYLRAAQPQPSAPADADTSASGADAVAWRMVFNHDTTELNVIGYTARDLIRFGYNIPKARVLGGPRWMDDETFRIVVNLDEPPAADTMPGIVRRVLEDRFQLATHVETRDFPAYALVTARPDKTPGPNLRVSTTDCFDQQAWIAAGQPPRELRRDAQRQPVCGEQSWDSTIARTSYVAVTMAELAANMRGPALERLAAADGDWRTIDVVDRTGLTGRFDVEIRAFLPTAALMGRYPIFKLLLEPLGVPSMERALEQQLGLKLEETTAPYDVIVIDNAQRPTG